eukprot:scaffold421_cov382-Prasinococcus_capsulatus_cf.AAC.3
MSKITLVADQHDNNLSVGMITQLLEPALHVVEGHVLSDIINQESSYGAPVVSTRNRPVSLLSCRVPDLCLDCLSLHLGQRKHATVTLGQTLDETLSCSGSDR